MNKRSKDKKYRKWHREVIKRDKACVLCGSTYRRAAHHIYDWSHHPESRYDLNNGVCLCGRCHSQFHTNFKKSYRSKCTKADWINFKCLVDYFKEALR